MILAIIAVAAVVQVLPTTFEVMGSLLSEPAIIITIQPSRLYLLICGLDEKNIGFEVK
jgi:hypothetical protein